MAPVFPFLFILSTLTYFNEAQAKSSFMLPKSVIPYHYKLEFAPDFYGEPNEFTLYGKAQIFAKIFEKTNYFNVHAVNITLTGHLRIVRNNNNNTNLYKSHRYDIENQWFVISLKESLQPGQDIIIQFTHYRRPITHTSTGIYYYTRKTADGKTNYGITSQMQSIFARQAFPCFDEPALKATFSITIFRRSSHFSLSNAPLKKSKKYHSMDWHKDEFDESPKMPTYLVTIIVTQYEGVSETVANVNFTFYYPRSMTSEHVALAMRISRQIFPVIQDYFDAKYPLSKLDQIGFSREDYHLGGMENFGLITYQDTFLYQDLTSSYRYPYIAKLILHELTHQWFGNLVTMKWWDDYWLNEGVTEYYSLLRGKWLAEEFDFRVLAQRYVLRAMSMEQNSVLYPIYVPWANTPDEIEEMRNDVTYIKGGMVIRMAELMMGENTFRKAMRDYIKKNLFGSVTHQDLWNEFSKANKENGVHLNMSRILTPWIMQSGFPLITVKLNYGKNTIDYTQELFAHTTKAVEAKIPVPNAYNYTWPLPIQWKTGTNGISKVEVAYDKMGSVRLPHKLMADDWLVVNPEANFYVIVNYEKEQWAHLGRHLETNYKVMDQYTRAKLIYDVVALYAATENGLGDFIDATTANKFFRFAKYETEHLPLVFFKDILRRSDPKLKPTLDILKSRASLFKKKKQRKGR